MNGEISSSHNSSRKNTAPQKTSHSAVNQTRVDEIPQTSQTSSQDPTEHIVNSGHCIGLADLQAVKFWVRVRNFFIGNRHKAPYIKNFSEVKAPGQAS